MLFVAFFVGLIVFGYAFQTSFPKYWRACPSKIQSTFGRKQPSKPHVPSYVVSFTQGLRPSMEDFHAVDIDVSLGIPALNGASIFSVFDGHCGKEAAEFAKKYLHRNIIQAAQSLAKKGAPVDLSVAMEEAFLKTDADFLELAKRKNFASGSTCVSALITKEHILVANVGDARCILCLQPSQKAIDDYKAQQEAIKKAKENESTQRVKEQRQCNSAPMEKIITGLEGLKPKRVPLRMIQTPYLVMSQDHKPNRPDEQIRIESSGGFIAHLGCWRVQGNLATSRSLGDKDLKPFVISTPEFVEVELSHSVERNIPVHIGNISQIMSNKCGPTLAGSPSPLSLLSPVALSLYNENAVDTPETHKTTVTENPYEDEGDIEHQFNSATLLNHEVKPTLIPAFLIIATDGLWDVFDNQEVADFIYHHRAQPSFAVDRLIQIAISRGSSDNVTVSVVDLRPHHPVSSL